MNRDKNLSQIGYKSNFSQKKLLTDDSRITLRFSQNSKNHVCGLLYSRGEGGDEERELVGVAPRCVVRKQCNPLCVLVHFPTRCLPGNDPRDLRIHRVRQNGDARESQGGAWKHLWGWGQLNFCHGNCKTNDDLVVSKLCATKFATSPPNVWLLCIS